MALPGSPLINPRIQFFDANGVPLDSGELYTYEAGTDTPLALYTDVSLDPVTAASNPVILQADGRPDTNLYMLPQGYKFVLKDQDGATIWTADNISDPAYVVFDTFANVAATGARDEVDGYVVTTDDNTVTMLPASSPNPCSVVLPAASTRGFPLTILNLSTTVDVLISPNGVDTINGQSGGLTLVAGTSPVFSGATLNSDGVSDWLLSAYW